MAGKVLTCDSCDPGTHVVFFFFAGVFLIPVASLLGFLYILYILYY